MAKKTISIVLPCFNEEAVLPKTMARVMAVVKQMGKKGFSYEIVLVDDGSKDGTKKTITEFCRRDKNIILVSLSRNFGHEEASLAGINATSGDAVVLMDADLQHPPEVILEMIKKWQMGADMVYGIRQRPKNASIFRKAAAFLFFRIMSYLSDNALPHGVNDFRLMDRKVVRALQKMPERAKFLRGMIGWLGFRQEPIYFISPPRAAGASKYNFRKLLTLATNSIFAFSNKPLKLATYLGFFVSFLSIIGIAYVFWVRLVSSTWVPGWAALMVTVLFIGGVQLIVLGILGRYISHIYDEAKARPVYVINEIIGGKQKNDKK